MLYGDNMQEGVAGFGKSPRAALRAFDEAWKKNLPELQRPLGNNGHDCTDEIRNRMGTCPECNYPWMPF